jgi:hypothetical protein
MGFPITPGRLPGQSSPTAWSFVNNLDIARKAISAGRSPNKDSMQTIEKKYRIFQRRGNGVRLFLAVNKKEERNRGNFKEDY